MLSPSSPAAASGAVHRFLVPGYDLAATLSGGQAFCWEPVDPASSRWRGWIGATAAEAWMEGSTLCVRGIDPAHELTAEEAAKYFQTEADLAALHATFPAGDEHLAHALAFCPGLRLLRQDPWETTANFICSSLKQIVQIQQINTALRRRFGAEIGPGQWRYPSHELLAAFDESDLRACKLGFRAKHLHRTARQLAAGEVKLEALHARPTAEARAELLRLNGIGEKVADCILLFAYGRLDAFPVDVWVARALHELYFPRRRQPLTLPQLRTFAAKHFGPTGGYAQQYLFHWVRTREKAGRVGAG